MKERTPKQEKAFQEQLKKDQRRFHISQRYQLVRDALFLINQATNRLSYSIQFYDCSQNPDFDDLHHNVYHAQSFIEFAYEKLEEIMDRDYELGCTPQQIGAEIKEKTNGRRKRNRSRKGKEGSQSK